MLYLQVQVVPIVRMAKISANPLEQYGTLLKIHFTHTHKTILTEMFFFLFSGVGHIGAHVSLSMISAFVAKISITPTNK